MVGFKDCSWLMPIWTMTNASGHNGRLCCRWRRRQSTLTTTTGTPWNLKNGKFNSSSPYSSSTSSFSFSPEPSPSSLNCCSVPFYLINRHTCSIQLCCPRQRLWSTLRTMTDDETGLENTCFFFFFFFWIFSFYFEFLYFFVSSITPQEK